MKMNLDNELNEVEKQYARFSGEEGKTIDGRYDENKDPSPSELKLAYEDGLRIWLDKSNCPWTLPSDISNRITLAGFVQKMLSEGRHLQSYPDRDDLPYANIQVGEIKISEKKDVIVETKENMSWEDLVLYMRGERQADDVINELELQRFKKEDAQRLYGLNPEEMQEKDLLKYWENHKVLTKVKNSIYPNSEPEKPWLPESLIQIYETCKEQLSYCVKDSITEYFSVSVENSEAFLAEMELAVRRIKTDAEFLKTAKGWQERLAKGCKREVETTRQVEEFDVEGKLKEIEELRKQYKSEKND
jgi:hypothetical protein